jgi:hypothetical protein
MNLDDRTLIDSRMLNVVNGQTAPSGLQGAING